MRKKIEGLIGKKNAEEEKEDECGGKREERSVKRKTAKVRM